MEKFQTTQGELESTRAQCSQWDDSSDNASEVSNHLMFNKQSTGENAEKRPKVIVEEAREEEVEDSFNLINDMLNPFNFLSRFLTKKGYIKGKETVDKSELNYKVLA
mmetsp:Transcript_9684/g.10863  ORF Transcript_9684/g.10863 Transcript_9684/m.10863 type:complete len:107 (-) Transcript_9684:551-871(-)|eukprot:CAMPEP_0168334298 /NCGR_PEP_ID=MMETSP0213-20121227/10174_1 /TAXON_ID=151035 /ORGANISM="Euplotes harpa, Strain FSP1.4" /LENGTH=106 /DNA_ID=CAMNT_0008338895 /DNA_START=21 /DNA_END=341 /DNA_ORIENTATION=-